MGLEGKGFLSEKEKRDAERADAEREAKAMKKMQAEKEQRRAEAVMLAQANRLAKFQASLVRGIGRFRFYDTSIVARRKRH